MSQKISGSRAKEFNSSRAIDPKLWERLIWQESLDKAIKRNQDKRVLKQFNH